MQTIILDNAPTGRRFIAFWVDVEFPTGEYQLVPVGEAADKDARIAELETKLAERDNQLTLARGDVEVYRKQLASRSPGVMPQAVKALARISGISEATMVELEAAIEAVEAHYAPHADHEWHRVDDANPITAADVGREIHCLGKVTGSRGSLESCVKIVQAHILRPVAANFVFTGEPGRYLAKWEDDNETPEECEICKPHNFPEGAWAALWDDGDWTKVNADGTFGGGRITGRVK